MVSKYRYDFKWFYFTAIFVGLLAGGCNNKVDEDYSSDKCQLFIFLGKASCPSCEIGLLRALDDKCVKSNLTVTFVTYYKGKVISPIIRDLDDTYKFTGYFDIDFSKIPIEKVDRDSVGKGKLFLIADGVLTYEYDFIEPLQLSEFLDSCSLCSNK